MTMLDQPAAKTAAEVKTYYHVTAYRNWPSIRANGLHAGGDDKIWLWDNIGHALHFSDQYTNDAVPPCILVVRTDATPTETFWGDAWTFDIPSTEVYDVIRPEDFHHYQSDLEEWRKRGMTEDYWGHHRPGDDGPPAYDLLQGEMMPDDVYEHPNYYTGYSQYIPSLMRVLNSIRGNPQAKVRIYRSAPPGVTSINTGDWVTLTREYAVQHGVHADDPSQDWPVISADVPAAMVRFAGDDLMEYGYWGGPTNARIGKVGRAPNLSQQHLDLMHQMFEQQNINPGGFYRSIGDIVRKHGKQWPRVSDDLPAGIKDGPLGDCYMNALEAVVHHRDLTYVEGYAVGRKQSFLPVAHAWVVDGNGTVYDPTWRQIGGGKDYFGIPFETKWLVEFVGRSGYTSVMGMDFANEGLLEILKEGLPDSAMNTTGAAEVTYKEISYANPESREIRAMVGDRIVGRLHWFGSGERYPEIHNVIVEEDYRRQGIASEMIRRAREIDPNLQHSTDLSDDAKAWIKSVGAKMPEGIEFRHTPDRGTEGRGVTGPGAMIEAIKDGQVIGGLSWFKTFVAGPMGHQAGQVEGVFVEEPYQRMGIATEMWRRAKEIEPRLHHSHALTDDGRAWSQTVAMPVGPAPSGVRYLFTANNIMRIDPQRAYCMMGAFLGSECIGTLTWGLQGRKVQSIWVKPEYRRRRIAETMFGIAKGIDPNITHHLDRSDAGDAWVRATSPDAPERENNTVENDNHSPNLVAQRLLEPRHPDEVRDVTPMALAALKTAMPMDPSLNLRFEVYKDSKIKGRGVEGVTYIYAFDADTDQGVGLIAFCNKTHREGTSYEMAKGEIYDVRVNATHQRRGVATRLLEKAREIEPAVHHSLNLSQEGEAWSKAVAAKEALPSWRDRGERPEVEALIAPDTGRARNNSFSVYLYGQPHARRPSLAEAKATVEEIYGDLEWVKVTGDTKEHYDRVWGWTDAFNDAGHYYVVERLPRLGTTSMTQERPNPDPVEYRHTPPRDPYAEPGERPSGHHTISAFLDGKQIGYLMWFDPGDNDWARLNPEMAKDKVRVDKVEVATQHRRQGIAAEMMRRALEITPGIKHSLELTSDGRAWRDAISADEAGTPAHPMRMLPRLGALPDGYTIEVHDQKKSLPNGEQVDYITVLVFHSGKPVAALGLDHETDPMHGEILRVDRIQVYDEHQRQGIATEMYAELHRRYPGVPVMHSFGPAQSADARALNNHLRQRFGPKMHLGGPGANQIARGLILTVENRAVARKFANHTITANEIVRVLMALDGGLGVWWGIMGSYGDLEDFKDHAWGSGDEDLLAINALAEDEGQFFAGGEVRVVLVAKRPMRGNEPWDPEHHNPLEMGGLMGNSYVENGEQLELLEIHYDAGDGYHVVNAEGIRARAGLQTTSAALWGDWSKADRAYGMGFERWRQAGIGLPYPALEPYQMKAKGYELTQASFDAPKKFGDVDSRRLVGTQQSVNWQPVKFYANPDSDYYRTGVPYADNTPANKYPRVYRFPDGITFILSGHHRAVAALINGKPLHAQIIDHIPPGGDHHAHLVAGRGSGDGDDRDDGQGGGEGRPLGRDRSAARGGVRRGGEGAHGDHLVEEGGPAAGAPGQARLASSLSQVKSSPIPIDYGGKFWGKGTRLYITDPDAPDYARQNFEGADPKTVAFLDYFDDNSKWIWVGFLTTRGKFEGAGDYQKQGLAGRLMDALYRLYPDKIIVWGEIMHPAAGRLRDQFAQRFPQRTGSVDDPPEFDPSVEGWRPTKGQFSPGKETLDPRLFDLETNLLKPEIVSGLLGVFSAFWDERYPNWRTWARLYIAGSAASYWWDSDADLDIMVGVDLDVLRRDRPANREVSDRDILARLNKGLTEELRPTTADMFGGFEVTWFVNPGAYDVNAIHPYAAIELTEPQGTWVVHPPKLPRDWGPQSYPESTWRLVDMAIREAEEVLSLPEPEMTYAASALYHWIHEGRRAAYSEHGGGWLDPGQVIYQALQQHPHRLLPRLYEAHKRVQAEEMLATASMADSLPAPLGETRIPPGTIRCYHYTAEEAVPSIERSGLLERYARGDSGMGAGNEPSAGVWAATGKPASQGGMSGPSPGQAVVEFWVKPDQVSQRAEYPWNGQDLVSWGNSGYHHIIVNGDVKPNQIVAVHMPWHGRARYMVDALKRNPEMREEWDEQFGKPSRGLEDYHQAWQWVKKHGSKTAMNMGYYMIDWAWQEHLDRLGGGRGQHDLTKTRTLPLLDRLCRQILADHGHPNTDVVLVRQALGESEADYDYDADVVTLHLDQTMRTKWVVLHEMAHALDLIEGSDEMMYLDNHGPLFKRRFTDLLKRYGKIDVNLEARPQRGTQAGKISTWWRVHPEGRAFGEWDATSKPFYNQPDAEPQRGYSCFENPWHLYLYVLVQWAGLYDGTTVLRFPGERVGTGHDGEDLAVPSALPFKTTWGDFCRSLPQFPLPPAPVFAPWVRGREEFRSWEALAERWAYLDQGLPEQDYIVARFARKPDRV